MVSRIGNKGVADTALEGRQVGNLRIVQCTRDDLHRYLFAVPQVVRSDLEFPLYEDTISYVAVIKHFFLKMNCELRSPLEIGPEIFGCIWLIWLSSARLSVGAP